MNSSHRFAKVIVFESQSRQRRLIGQYYCHVVEFLRSTYAKFTLHDFSSIFHSPTGKIAGKSVLVHASDNHSFLSLISESETHILYRFVTHRVKYFKPLFLEILMIMAYR